MVNDTSTLTMDLLSFDDDEPHTSSSTKYDTYNPTTNGGALIELDNVTDHLSGGGYKEPVILGPEPEILNKEILTSQTPASPRLSDFGQSQISGGDDPVRQQLRRKLSYISLAFAAVCMVLAIVALVISGTNGGRFVGSLTYSILAIVLALRAIFPPRVDSGCFRAVETHPIAWFSVSLACLCAGVIAGWLIEFRHHESAFANGIFIFAFIDMVYFAAEQLHQQMYITIAVLVVLLILDVFIHYEVTYSEQNVGFDIFGCVMILVHAPVNLLSITHRWDMIQLNKKKKKKKKGKKYRNLTVNANDDVDDDDNDNDDDTDNNNNNDDNDDNHNSRSNNNNKNIANNHRRINNNDRRRADDDETMLEMEYVQ